jgi:4-carboxymuconolactone decarboxylase
VRQIQAVYHAIDEETPMRQSAAVVLSVLVLASARPATPDDGDLVILRSEAQTPSPAPAEHFAGSALVYRRFHAAEPGRASGAFVAFEPGARTDWHAHALGQTLIVTSGVGRAQAWGGPVEEIRTGDIVWVPAGQKHWHGASPTTSMTHVAIGERLGGESVEWMEKVTDEQYAAPVRARPAAAAASDGQPTRAQQLMGDLAPKLAQLTDDVLYGDVWERPQLSRRDRSLVTIGALVALNRPDQLRSHIALALRNGVTEEEIGEAITHLAFYAGWPSAVTAVQVAREALGQH